MDETDSNQKDDANLRSKEEVLELMEKRRKRKDYERKKLDKWNVGKKKFS